MVLNKRSILYFLAWLVIGVIIGIGVLTWQGALNFSPNFTKPDFSLFGHKMGHKNSAQRGYHLALEHALSSVVSIQAINWVESMPSKNTKKSDQHSINLLSKNLLYLSPKKPIIASGSGVIINSSGYILTSYHVIAQRDEIRITLNDGRSSLATLTGFDIDTDLAVLKIALDDLPTLDIANIIEIKVGDIVLAIGNPFSLGLTVTQGIISATGRKRIALNSYANFIQTDAAVNPGNSGGALINIKGEIIGINSNIYTNSGNFQGISFAIPIDLAQNVAQQIIAQGHVVRGWLGVEGRELTSQVRRTIDNKPIQGVLISDIDLNGPSDLAGLKIGDIITRINQKTIIQTSDILDQLATSKPGDIFIIEGIRQQQSYQQKVTLGQRPHQSTQ